jgi:hypothetical protein
MRRSELMKRIEDALENSEGIEEEVGLELSADSALHSIGLNYEKYKMS